MARSLTRALLVAALVLLAGARARARDEITPVHVVRTDGAPLDGALRASLRELLGRVNARLIEGSASAGERGLSVSLTLGPDAADVAVARAGGARIVRRVPLEGSDAVRREVLAHVALGLVESLLTSEEPARSVVPPAPSPPLESPPPPVAQTDDAPDPSDARRSVRWRSEALAGAQALSRETLAARIALSLAAVSSRRLQPALGLDGAVTPRGRLSQPGIVDARLWLVSLRVRPGFTPFSRGRFSLELALPLGVDLARLKVDRAAFGIEHRERTTRFDPVLGLELALRIALARGVSLALRAGADLDATPRRFLVSTRSEHETLVSLARVRPQVMLGCAFGGPRRSPP